MKQTGRNIGSIALWVGALVAAAAVAQQPPSTQPNSGDAAIQSDDVRDRPSGPRRGGPEGFRPGNGMNPRGGPAQRPFLQPMSQEEYDRATAFMREYMPNVSEVWEALPERFRQRRMMPPRLAAAFRLLMEAEARDDSAMVELLSRQLRLRDEFLGDLIELRRTGGDRLQIRESLREKTREIVMANLEQRELRVKQMEERLAAEREKLAREREDPDQLVEGQLNAMMEESAFFLQALRRQWGNGPATRPGDAATPEGTPAYQGDRPTSPPRP